MVSGRGRHPKTGERIYEAREGLICSSCEKAIRGGDPIWRDQKTGASRHAPVCPVRPLIRRYEELFPEDKW